MPEMRAFLFVLWVSGGAPVGGEVPEPAEIRARLESHDRAVHVLDVWMRDPYVVLAPDGWFYLTGTTQRPDLETTEETRYNTGLGKTSLVGWKARIWRSRDLATWEPLGAPYTLKDGIWFRARPERFEEVRESEWRLWAPELHWVGERWALVHTSPSPVQGANLSLSRGPEPEGPWSNPMGSEIGRRHDPSLFRDTDGTWWLVWGATEIAPLKPDFSGLSGARTRIGPAGELAKMGHEGCLLRKLGETYVLFGTGWSTGSMRKGSYNLYYATATTITGPYSERTFAGRFLGHGTPFQDTSERWWCTAFFNANVPPLDPEGIEERDLSETAQTINPQGVTLVPLSVETSPDGEVHIRAKDPRYATPGPDEAQQFGIRPSEAREPKATEP